MRSATLNRELVGTFNCNIHREMRRQASIGTECQKRATTLLKDERVGDGVDRTSTVHAEVVRCGCRCRSHELQDRTGGNVRACVMSVD